MDSFNIKVQNDKIVNVTDTVIHILHGVSNNNDISLFIDESPDLEQLVMGQELFLDFLRQLCERFNYKPDRITIEIENLIQSDCWPNLIRCYRSLDVLGGQMMEFEGMPKQIKYKTSLFVGGSRWPRLALASFLYSSYRDESLITYWQNLKDRKQPCYLYVDDLLKNYMSKGIDNNFLEQLKVLLEALPLHLGPQDQKENNNGGFIHWASAYDLLPYYKQIYCDVVCETVHNGKTFAFTEKIARCWMTKTPFLVFGPRNYLANLKRLGIKTFETFWNEQYDRYENVNRISMIQQQINTIHRMDTTQLQEIYNSSEMQSILENNYKVFKELDRKKIQDCFI